MKAIDKLIQRFPERRVCVTGAASGLGLALIRQLLAEPGRWSIAMLDVAAERLAAARESLLSAAAPGTVIQYYPLDVRDLAAQQAAVNAFAAMAGGVDIAINAAGVAATGPFIETAAEDWEWSFDINVHGVANSCRATLPWMLQQGSGLIINIASAASFCTGPQMGAYNASKAAVVALSETLMQEYGPKDIQVMVAMPGFFRTALLEGARGPSRVVASARRIMSDSGLDADTVAAALLAYAAAGNSHWVYPRRYRKLWWLKRLMPARFQTVFPKLAVRRG